MSFPAAGSTFKAYLDDAGMITRVHTTGGDASLARAVVEFQYAGYKDHDILKAPASATPGGAPSGGIPFPSHIVQKVNGEVVLDIMLTEVTLNGGLVLEVPPSVNRASRKK